MAPRPVDQPAAFLKLPLAALMRWVYLVLALLFLLLGIIGAFLPVLPTTPFILLSAWAAARSSPRLVDWLENHTAFGPIIRDWRRGGVVSRRAKWMATVMMAASALYLLLTLPSRWAVGLAIGTMTLVAIWLWRRPERIDDRTGAGDGPGA